MSLRVRIALVVVVVVAVAVSVVGVLVHSATERELVQEVDIELQNRADALITSVARGPQLRAAFSRDSLRGQPDSPPLNGLNEDGFGGRLGARAILQDAVVRDTLARIISRDGTVVVNLGGDFEADVELDELVAENDEPLMSDGSVDGDRARVITLAINEGFVQIARPLDEIDQSLADLSDRIVAIALFAIVVAGGGAWFVSGGTVRPIRRLTEAAEQVADTGDFNHPVAGSGGDEVGRLADSFNSMLASLAVSKEQQRRLVMDASHELRTPLASLRTNADVLVSGREIPEDMRRAIVDDMSAEVDELAALAAELVDLATDVDSDEELVVTTLSDLARPVAEREARRTGREIEVVVDSSVDVRVRPLAMARAIRNLIENAAKFSPDYSSIIVRVDGGSLTVIDKGHGIPPDERELVFERFHRVESSRNLPGSGLGLSIVKQVIDSHGGTVTAAPASDFGSSTGAAVGFALPVID